MILIEYAPDQFHDLEPTIKHVQSCLFRRGVEVVLLSEVTDATPEPDMVIVVGGDGTIMRSLQRHKAPVFGINGGTVGFLAGSEDRFNDIEIALQRLLNHDYLTEDRLALHALIVRRSSKEQVVSLQPIVNEVAVQHDQSKLKFSLVKMWTFSLSLMGVDLNLYSLVTR